MSGDGGEGVASSDDRFDSRRTTASVRQLLYATDDTCDYSSTWSIFFFSQQDASTNRTTGAPCEQFQCNLSNLMRFLQILDSILALLFTSTSAEDDVKL